MLILMRPPNDNFTFRMFFKLTRQIATTADIFYVWSAVLDPTCDLGIIAKDDITYHINEILYREELFRNIKNDLVVLGIKDHLTTHKFNPLSEECPNLVSYIKDMTNFYKDKKFIIFTSLENLETYINKENVFIIPWGADITNQHDLYPTIEPVINKNLNSPRTFISLNRNNRFNRALAVSFLFALGLDSKGVISCMFKNQLNSSIFKDYREYFTEFTEELALQGIELASSSNDFVSDDYVIYPENNNDNVYNFNNKLKNYYKNSFIEIVAETSYTESAFLVTEKTLNSIYGCNFPIFLASQGTVSFLRTLGFDMFDDIIDHSYDSILNPIDRAYNAISLNLKLLECPDLVKDIWFKNQTRFLNNVEFARKGMYDFYKNRAENKFKEIINIVN